MTEAQAILLELRGGTSPSSSPIRFTDLSTATPTGEAVVFTAGQAESGLPAAESIESVLADLGRLIGLRPVKEEVRKLLAVQQLNMERARHGLPEIGSVAHLVFTGDPGTGKTTVARLVARLYKAVGAVSQGHLVEASRADLVAGYVGQTALKVQDVVRSAVGGILFIDEAYALAGGHVADYGSEAIASLVKLMEDNRGDLVVIVAGYREEMGRFITSNPGLSSRFTRYIDFPNYSSEELVQIFAGMADQARVRTASEVLAGAQAVFQAAAGEPNFGNARFVRTFFERAYANMAARAVADGRIVGDELDQMTVADLPTVEVALVQSGRVAHRRIP